MDLVKRMQQANRCAASKPDGSPCRCPAQKDAEYCWRHDPRRKPTKRPRGRPPESAVFADPDGELAHHGRLGELFEAHLNDPMLKDATMQIALMKAALQLRIEEWQAGQWTLDRDPADWVIETAGKIADRILRVRAAAYSTEFEAAKEVLRPIVTIIHEAVEQNTSKDVGERILNLIGSRVERVVMSR